MKLNYDCVRELLLTLESNLIMDNSLSYVNISLNKICELMPEFSKEEIAYASLKLDEAEYIIIKPLNADNKIIDIRYSGITYEGHQYLDSIRDAKLWNVIKSNSKALTFGIIKKLAEKYVLSKFIP